MSTKEEETTTNSTTGRGTVSSRGRGGGFMPKKKLHEQIQSLELTSTEESKSEENIVKEKFRIQEESDESDNDSDSETDQNKKRCDFCGDTNHQDRFCPLLQKKDDGHKQGKISNKQPKVSCFYCHEEGHVRADCPKRALIKCCFYCKKEGHFKADCPEKAVREAKKRERVMLNYTFRKASQKETKTCSTMSGNNVADVFYQGPEENSEAVESKPRVIVPYPVKASQAKSEVKLRSKLLASESDPSIPRKILRSESSEEEEEMESVDSDENSKENNEKEMKLEDQNGEQKVKAGNGEEELQTISIEVDGCVEFDSGDDRSYYDCSEGEDDGDGRKRAMEADELYGEDGALISEGEEPMKEEGKKEEEQIAKQE